MPLLTQSDPGTENNGVANAHTTIRRLLDPELEGTVQHRFMHGKKNIKAEILWSIFRRDFAIGYEEVFQQGLDNGWYDPDIEIEWYVNSSGVLGMPSGSHTTLLGSSFDGLLYRSFKRSSTSG